MSTAIPSAIPNACLGRRCGLAPDSRQLDESLQGAWHLAAMIGDQARVQPMRLSSSREEASGPDDRLEFMVSPTPGRRCRVAVKRRAAPC